jgi:hypothetical protein
MRRANVRHAPIAAQKRTSRKLGRVQLPTRLFVVRPERRYTGYLAHSMWNAAGATRLRSLVNLVLVPIVAFVGEIAATKSSDAAELHRLLLGCWQHERHTKERLVGRYLVCFRKDGRVTGVTIDAGDGRDWAHHYRIKENEIFFDGTSWGHVQTIAADNMIIDRKDTQIDFELVCRTKRQDIQCERLTEKIAR